MQPTSAETGDYLVWRDIDYRPVVESLLPTKLLEHLTPGQRVLEIGCGRGDVALFLARHDMNVEGLDINPDAISAAQERAESAGLSNRARFRAVDFVRDPLPDAADAVVLIRVLTCFPEDSSWMELVRRAKQCVRPGGLLFVHDFLVTPDVYASRYQAGQAMGWRYGNFMVPDELGRQLFVARHHTDSDICTLLDTLDPVELDRHVGISMRGHSCSLFSCVARRTI